MALTVAKIYSALGNPDSLLPLAVKDSASTAGMTTASYLTGKEEGVDRFIDEVGTELIWLGGLPFFKTLFNWIGFKPFKLDHNFDARNLKNKDIFKKTKELAPTEEIKKEIEKIGKNEKLFKNLVIGKFAVATALTVGSYIGLTKFKHHYTAKKIRQNLINEHAQENESKTKNEALSAQTTFHGNKKTNSPSFKGIGSMVEGFVFSSVKNMWILDGCITGERLWDSRSPQEFIGYGIKEASTLCFMYYAGGKIQKLAENYINKKHNKSIALDARVIEGNLLQKVFENGSVEKSIKEFEALNGKPVDVYEFLHKNPDNFVVKACKKSDVIKLYKNTKKIDTREYIDLKDVEGVKNKLKELYSQYKTALKNGESSEKFFEKVKKLKRKSIRLNIGSCMVALGIITPGIMLLKRLTDKNGSEFRTKEEIRNQLKEEGIIS